MLPTISQTFMITYERRGPILFAMVEGVLENPRKRLECWRDILRRCRHETADRLLVVQDCNGFGTTMEAFVFSVGIVKFGLRGIKLAVADGNPEHESDNEFAAAVAVERGANLKVFTSEMRARDWLLSDENAAAPETERRGIEEISFCEDETADKPQSWPFPPPTANILS